MLPMMMGSAQRVSTKVRRPLADREGPMIRLVLASVIGLMAVVGFGQTSANAQPESCLQHVAGGIPPALLKPQLARGTQMLCYEEFAVLHSAAVRTPLWSAEHLTREQIEAASQLKRRNAFHSEPRLPASDRAKLADYSRSGYDRGHMSPSGDMPTPKAQRESFSLANIIPQHPCNNEVLWEGIESAVRDLASAEGEIYVVTGPIYEGTDIPFLNGRVGVPSRVYKAVYDPVRRGAAAYVTPNADGMDWQGISIDQLAQITGIDPFPAIPAEIKAVAMPLPTPQAHFGCRLR
jgi:endonuclease G, mitochondrial